MKKRHLLFIFIYIYICVTQIVVAYGDIYSGGEFKLFVNDTKKYNQ